MARRRPPASVRSGDPHVPAAAPVALILLAAAAAGLIADKLPAVPLALVVAGIPVAFGVAYVIAQGPLWCLAALIGTTFTGFYQQALPAGPLDLRPPDIFYAGLVGWVLLLRRRQPREPAPVGQRAIGWLLAAFGFSIVVQAVTAGGALHFIPWLRFVETVSLVWLVPYAIDDVRDVRFVFRASIGFAAFEVVRASAFGVATHGLGARVEGANGPNATGLLAALLLVYAARSGTTQTRLARVAIGLTGLVGLGLTRSVGSIVAAGIGFLVMRAPMDEREADPRRRPIALAASLLLVITVVTVGITVLRPDNLPWSSGFKQSTTANRLIVATAGLYLFTDHPIAGVGWQRSSDSDVIGAPELSDRLRSTYTGGYLPEFFPDARQTTVHNAWMQVFTEAGILGAIALAVVVVTVVRRTRRLLWRLRVHREVSLLGRVAVAWLVTVVVWWNDNPFFGAQPETVTAATMLGILASLPRVLAVAVARDEAPQAEPVGAR